MSFLNPISEPVLMFSSTDASAPQINYAARAAGDVKTVLKACLVTGYGSKQSAGWSIQNETDFAAEFVSPSTAMIDYVFGVDDNSNTKTTWYYKYRTVLTTPSYSNPTKNFNYVDLSHANNGWRLIVTNRGLCFIELLQSTVIANVTARVTYIGNIKSALIDKNNINIAFFNIGQDATISDPALFYNNYPHIRVDTYSLYINDSTPFDMHRYNFGGGVSQVDLTSSIYVVTVDPTFLVGEIPGLLLKVINNESNIYGISQEAFNNRPVLKVCAGFTDDRSKFMYYRGRVMLIYLDNWSY